jgi:D-sedoheptulose 7-phosphate isomerase
MLKQITALLDEAIETKVAARRDQAFLSAVAIAAKRMAATIRSGGTIYACGNGGSTCDAMHLVEELVARYKRDRPGIRAMHLMDPSTMTCWSNDCGFESAFQRVVETFCTPKDILIAISTSGNSGNILAAVDAAQKRGSYVVALTGRGGGKLAKIADVSIVVPSNATERIQEVHITCVHIWCELFETVLAKEIGASPRAKAVAKTGGKKQVTKARSGSRKA